MIQDTSTSWIANLQPGDDVIVANRCREKLSKVKSISPKLGLITLVDGMRFNKLGHEPNGDTWDSRWLREATPKAKLKLKEDMIFKHYSRGIKDNLDKLIKAKSQGFVSGKHLQKLTLIHLELKSLIEDLSQ